jgi:acetyl esterase/lipase
MSERWEQLIDPELVPFIRGLPRSDLSDPVAARRQAVAAPVASDGPHEHVAAQIDHEDLIVPGPSGAPDVRVRVYRPPWTPDRRSPALVWLHGGGFVRGSIETDHLLAARTAAATRAIVVSVGYRLAPEAPFPAALDDALAVLHWLAGHAEHIGVDADRIGLAGVSAGGAIAAGTALAARDRDLPGPVFQALLVPVLDDRLSTPSMREFVDTPLWDRGLAEQSWRHYLGPDRAEVSPYAAPARADDLTGLPAAYIQTAAYDPLRDEGIAYAARLLAAGVPVELHHFPGTFHGSHLFPAAAVARRQFTELTSAIRAGLSQARAPGAQSGMVYPLRGVR